MKDIDSGLVHEKTGRYRLARRFYEQAARLLKAEGQDPTPAWWSLAANYYYWGRTVKARRYFRLVLSQAVQPTLRVTMLANLGDTFAHRENRPAKALPFYKAILKEAGTSADDKAWAWLGIGHCLGLQNQWQAALQAIDTALTLWQGSDDEARSQGLAARLEALLHLGQADQFQAAFPAWLEYRQADKDRSHGGGLISLLFWPSHPGFSALLEQAGYASPEALAIALEAEALTKGHNDNLLKLWRLPLFPAGYRRHHLGRLLTQMGYDPRQAGRLIGPAAR